MILKWNGLVMALSQEWRNTVTRAAPENLSNELNVRIVSDGKAVLLKDLKTKTVYNIFVKEYSRIQLLKNVFAETKI